MQKSAEIFVEMGEKVYFCALKQRLWPSRQHLMTDFRQEHYINPYTDFGFKKLFPKLFEQAEIARFTPQDVRDYEESIKIYRDLTNVVNTAERKGREEGIKEGREEGREEERMATARRMKADGLPPEMIAKYTGLTIEAVQHL